MVFERFAIKITRRNGESAFIAFGNSYETNDPRFFMLYSTEENAKKVAKKKLKSIFTKKADVIKISCEYKED